MRKFNTIATVIFALVVMSVIVSQVFAYHEDPEIDMQYTANPTIGELVTIDCTKGNTTDLNMLMTVFEFDTRKILAEVYGSDQVISHTLTPQDSSMIQIFCEFIDDNEDKVGYAVMRTITPKA